MSRGKGKEGRGEGRVPKLIGLRVKVDSLKGHSFIVWIHYSHINLLFQLLDDIL